MFLFSLLRFGCGGLWALLLVEKKNASITRSFFRVRHGGMATRGQVFRTWLKSPPDRVKYLSGRGRGGADFESPDPSRAERRTSSIPGTRYVARRIHAGGGSGRGVLCLPSSPSHGETRATP